MGLYEKLFEKPVLVWIGAVMPDRRKRDMDNCLAMMKPYQDGICDALGVDDSRIKRTVLEWGDVVKGGKVVLRLEEME